ncbi:MAG: polymer-forming cytoskeletal protein [Sandaracinaceae bacterium]
MNRARTDGLRGAELRVQGRLEGASNLRIDGALEGEIDVEGGLWIGPEGRVVAPLSVTRLDVEGEVRGPVRARAVSVRAGGRVLGDVMAGRVTIEDGGALHGGIDMEFDLPTDEVGR